ncbi:MAG: general secretion pathway protein GspN [Betaproteobacteria bacterium RBG_16_56_24]|nr:MAG: general secretion pathway protein GspN [Betaproteobacteria bacterium RBG_16_56_24]
MRRLVVWFAAGFASVLLTVLMFLPASWLALMVEKQTAGRLTLGDAHGTLWRGSAFIGGAAGGSDAVTPLLPGRFTWRLSPMILLGSVDAELENDAALTQPVSVTGNWQQWQVSAGAILLPAERLAALGAPLNTVQPSGQMRLSWQPLQLARQDGKIGVTGSMNLEMNDLASRMSPIKPLGAYDLSLDWRGLQASAILKTLKGPLLLSGSGTVNNGSLQFSGKAEAEAGQEERLANFLNLLGQRRKEGGKDVIALEFK